MENIVLLGSTGSIGKSVLDVIRNYPGRFHLTGVSGFQNLEKLESIIREFAPVFVSVPDLPSGWEAKYPEIQFLTGEKGLTELAELPEADTVVIAVSGIAGLSPTLASIRAKKRILSANKESIVAAGDIVNHELDKTKNFILPLDSEHNAVFNLLSGRNPSHVAEICLTASGGPFLRKEITDRTTRQEVLKHPTWDMGNYITVNSATLMNKGFEVIEAHYLFRQPYDKIRVLIHPQSIVHGALRLKDGTFLLAASPSDMRFPIALSLFHPEIPEQKFAHLDFTKMRLDFEEPDMVRFPLLKLAYDCGAGGGVMPAVLNAANEAAVDAFLKNQVSFYQLTGLILHTVEDVIAKTTSFSSMRLEEILEAHRLTREAVLRRI